MSLNDAPSGNTEIIGHELCTYKTVPDTIYRRKYQANDDYRNIYETGVFGSARGF